MNGALELSKNCTKSSLSDSQYDDQCSESSGYYESMDSDEFNEENEDSIAASRNDSKGISEYEKLRLERIQRNKEYLASLGLEKHEQNRKNKLRRSKDRWKNVEKRASIQRQSKIKEIRYASPKSQKRIRFAIETVEKMVHEDRLAHQAKSSDSVDTPTHVSSPPANATTTATAATPKPILNSTTTLIQKENIENALLAASHETFDDSNTKQDIISIVDDTQRSITYTGVIQTQPMQDALKLISEAKKKLSYASIVLDHARAIASNYGLSVDSSILDATYQSGFLPSRFRHGIVNENAFINVSLEDPLTEPNNPSKSCVVLSTTGGHSNTNHVILSTGNPFADKLAEYKRLYKRRARAIQPEQRGIDRWDQPRVQGSRRRRITRELDLPSAPPEPPLSGYVVFVGQMTVKMRHDRPHVKHNQINAVGEISKAWRFELTDSERAYYNQFSKEAREEYKTQYREFRATGVYTKSIKFEKMQNVGPWVHKLDKDKNALEKELATYPTVIFPPKPILNPTQADNDDRRNPENHSIEDDSSKDDTMVEL